jgi:hypothetical protein
MVLFGLASLNSRPPYRLGAAFRHFSGNATSSRIALPSDQARATLKAPVSQSARLN